MASSSSLTESILQKVTAILDSRDHHPIQQLVSNLESSEDAKLVYDSYLSERPEQLCFDLFFLILLSEDISDKDRDTCANLLHHLLSSAHHFSRVWTSESNKQHIKTSILLILKQSFPKEISKAMWSIASCIFNRILIEEQGKWPSVLNLFSECLNSDSLYIQDNALMFFLDLPTCLGEELRPFVHDLHSNLRKKLNTSTGERKVLVLASIVNLVRNMSADFYFLFQNLVTPMLRTVSSFLHNDVTEDNAQRSLKKLEELVGAEPRFFDAHLNQVYKEMATIGINDLLGKETRILAIKVMYAFDDVSLQRVQKRILQGLCSELINLISFTPDGSTICPLQEKFILRISMVENMFYFTHMWNTIAVKFNSSDWRERYAAITVINIIAKGCKKALTDNLTKVMKVVRLSMIDSSCEVQFATIRTVKSMCLGLHPHTLDEYADVLISWLHLEILDQKKPFKQTAAISALCSLCEKCSSCIVEPRLGTIVRKLIEFLKSENVELQKESINTLASFAKLSKALFCQDYNLVITSLKEHLAGSTSKSLRVNSADCICKVAMAVGNDIFSKDAAEVVALLLSVRCDLGEDDHNLQVNLLQAWEQLLKCLGSHIYPYTKDLMPNLLTYASLDSNSASEHVILIEKLKACKLLLWLTKQLKGKFSPWINQVSDIMVPLVKFHHKDIRIITSSALPNLLLSTKLSFEDEESHGVTNSYLHELVVRFVSSLLEALDEETDGKVCENIMKSLTNCIKIAGKCLNETTIQQTANTIEQVLKATSKNHFSKKAVVNDLEKKIIKQRDDVTAKEKETALLTFNERCITCKGAAKRY